MDYAMATKALVIGAKGEGATAIKRSQDRINKRANDDFLLSFFKLLAKKGRRTA